MPVTEEVSGDSLVTLNWSIEHFNLSSCCRYKFISSPRYEFKKLGSSRWRLELFPKGSFTKDYIACYVRREVEDTTSECDRYDITLSLSVGDDAFFEKTVKHTFDETNFAWMCDEFIRIDLLKRQHLPNNVLTIKCKLYPEHNPSARSDQRDFEILSRDLTNLLESTVQHDLVLVTDGTQFKVHKSILAVRWPSLMDKLGIEGGFTNAPNSLYVPDTNAFTLEALIRYAYSGTIDETNVPREVFKTALRYKFDTLRKNLTVYPKEYFGVSECNIEHKTVIWHLDDIGSWDHTPLSFIRVLPITKLYIHQIIITFHTAKTKDGDEAIDISFRFSNFKENSPVYFECKMSLSDQRGESRDYHTANHLFLTGEVWHFPQFIKKSDIIDTTESRITMELTMSDGHKLTRIGKTETEFFSDFTPTKDLRKLSTDLSALSVSNTNWPGDSNLVCKDGTKVPVHHAIIWARWPELRYAFDARVADDNDFCVQLDIEESLLKDAIRYIYSGNSGDIEIETAQGILQAANKVPFPKTLEQKCKEILENAVEK